MTNLRRTLYAATVAGSLLLASTTVGLAAQAQRGNSGLPPGPGNPIAAVYDQVKALNKRVTDLENSANQSTTMWINHLDLVPGGAEVQTLYSSTSSGVGTGLSGLIVMSSTIGETFTPSGNKVIEKGLEVPPNYNITGVRICYESLSASPTTPSFISQVRLSQLQDPPSVANILHDDATDLTNAGPICVNSTVVGPAVNPSLGAVRLSLRVYFANTLDKIVIRGLGLLLQRTHL